MSELVMRICVEKNVEAKLALVEELKQVLDDEAELLKVREAKKQPA